MALILNVVGGSFRLASGYTADEVIRILEGLGGGRRTLELADGGRLLLATTLTTDWALAESPDFG